MTRVFDRQMSTGEQADDEASGMHAHGWSMHVLPGTSCWQRGWGTESGPASALA